jgi:hypothetical protein
MSLSWLTARALGMPELALALSLALALWAIAKDRI